MGGFVLIQFVSRKKAAAGRPSENHSMAELLQWWIDFFAVAAQGENFDGRGFDALLLEPLIAEQNRFLYLF
jgi:hypothetical protein